MTKRLLAGFSINPCSKVLRRKDLDYLDQILQTLRAKMDYVIIDSSPFGLFAESESIASICDGCVIVMEQNCVEARIINDTLDQLNEISGKVIGCIFNNVYPTLLGRTVNSQTPYGYGYGHYHRYHGKSGYSYGYGYGYSNGYGNHTSQVQISNDDETFHAIDGKE